jgi:hypothetical protein
MQEFQLADQIEGSGGRRRRVRVFAEHSPLTGTAQNVPAEVTICKGIGRLLEFHYPGHPWGVEVNIEQGYAKISIPDLLGPNWGYIVHLDKMSDKLVIEAGGHILERFKMPRNRIDVAHYLQRMKEIPLLGIYRAKDGHRIPT